MRIIIVGFGTVGKSFAGVLHKRRDELLKVFGLRPRIVAVVDRGGAAVDSNGLDFERISKAKQISGTVSIDKDHGRPGTTALEVIREVEADVIVELSPTNIVDGEPGLSHIEAALKRKRHVVTANKGPLALALPALMELASYNNVFLKFSGAVGGGTPILDLGKKCLLGDRVASIRGILNGTTNYILTRMTEARIPMNPALKEAQAAGYAEANPRMDVEGLDSACKLVILANWVMGRHITIRDVEIHGITNVSSKDIEEAEDKGCVVKLIGSIDEKEVMVKPQHIPRTNPLNVAGTLNAVTFGTEFAGEITIVGHGAGGIETAGAVLRDLIDIRRNIVL